MKRVFNIGVFLYILFIIVLFHGYLFTESPIVSVSLKFDGSNYDTVVAEDRNYESVDWVNEHVYCVATDYIYEEGKNEYINNKCIDYLLLEEFTQVTPSSALVTTYYRQFNYVRTGCRLYNVSDNHLEDCTTTQVGEDYGYYPRDAEAVEIIFSSAYSTTWGETVQGVKTRVRGAGCDLIASGSAEEDVECVELEFDAGEAVKISVDTLCQLAGVSLDEENVDSGGVGATFNQSWPIYRMTGAEFSLELTFSNFYPYVPFDFTESLEILVTLASAGSWKTTGDEVIYTAAVAYNSTGEAATATIDPWEGDDTFSIREPYGIVLSFTAGGTVGTPNFWSFMYAVVGSIVLFAVATSMVDITAGMVIQGFRTSKFEDDTELRIKKTLRVFLEKHVEAEEEGAEEDEDAVASCLTRVCCIDVEAERELGRKAAESAENNNVKDMTHDPKFPEFLDRLVIENDEYHGKRLYACGTPNAAAVSATFTWYRGSPKTRSYVKIEGVCTPDYFATAADKGHLIKVEVCLLNDLGQTGEKETAKTQLLNTQFHVADLVADLVEVQKGHWTVSIVGENSSEPADLTVTTKMIHIKTHSAREQTMSRFQRGAGKALAALENLIPGDSDSDSSGAEDGNGTREEYKFPLKNNPLISMSTDSEITFSLSMKGSQMTGTFTMFTAEERDVFYLLVHEFLGLSDKPEKGVGNCLILTHNLTHN
ncbi:hypothetical protein CYMTET_12813 [Cymbomonas tetramitiformis]|uniref:Uncharacterized protein n=1 Tax=Cymbomonas tetramitiformis TaxID=36881 RepID=A0AAE0GJJ4_9CHLO|nr:hypothetical protein CYMTET_12813 [Cymbomonas tetramitiformis]